MIQFNSISPIDGEEPKQPTSLWSIFIGFLVVVLLALLLQRGLLSLFKFMQHHFNGFLLQLVAPEVFISGVSFLSATCFFTYFIEKSPLQSLGFRFFSQKGLYLKGWLIGIALITLVYGLNSLLANINCYWNGWDTLTMGSYFMAFAFQGLGEEVLCRGYLMNRLCHHLTLLWGIILNSFLFSLLHWLNPSISALSLLNIFLAGVFFSTLFYRYESIWLVSSLHSAWNFMLGPVLGVPVSGIRLPHTWLVTYLPNESLVWHGGYFGFEGGVVVTFILSIGIIWELFYIRKFLMKKPHL